MKENKETLDKNLVLFCQYGSNWFNDEIENDLGDWRSTRGRLAIQTGKDPDSRSPVQIGQPIKKFLDK